MSRNVEFDRAFFRDILVSEGVGALTKNGAHEVADVAVSSAPVDTGAYQAGIGVEAAKIGDRIGHLVVGSDSKTLLIEAKTGNLARALRTVQGR